MSPLTSINEAIQKESHRYNLEEKIVDTAEKMFPFVQYKIIKIRPDRFILLEDESPIAIRTTQAECRRIMNEKVNN